MKKENLIFIGVGILLLAILVLVVILTKDKEVVLEEDLKNISYEIEGNELSMDQYQTENPVVALYIKNYGSVVIELYPDVAPNTVNNFISLVKSGFYDGNTFHRLMTGFVLQGGDPTGTGTGGPGYTIKGEFTNNGFTNDLKHEKGIVSMARSTENDSAGSQFFIMLGEASYLDGNYAAFGKVIDGMELVEAIEKNERVVDSNTGQLQTNLVLEKAVVDLKGKEYPEVEKMDE
ncbi:MAG: peptidylprolyl isomerase [Bacilli bacterium]|nr:peptidylprolyl isomerase [Bacilli bacterium]